ncbi:MAG: hypothetical protein K2X98_01325, partial [Alphaproteobacteria bacterium]|nr:hypothetical protein [Alphaproteobacteria bacterium]
VGYVTHLDGFDLEISMLQGSQSTVNPFMVINKYNTGAVSVMTTDVLEYIFFLASISKDSAPGIADIFDKVACINTQFDKRVTFPLPSKLEHKKPKTKEKEQQRTRLNTLLQGIKSSLSKSGHEIRIETVLNTLDRMSIFKNFVTSLDPNDPLRQDFDAQHSDLEMFASALLQETEDQPRDQEEYCNSDQAKEDMKGMIHQLLTWDGQTIDHFDLQGPQDAYQLVQVIYTVLEDVQQNPQAYNAENNIDQIIQSGESLAEFLHKKFQLVRYV